jgi:IS30 family transposase
MQYEFLTFEDRKKIEELYNNGTRVAEIAQTLGRCENTIYNDLRKGLTNKMGKLGRRIYSSKQAQEIAQQGIKNRGGNTKERNKK